MKKYKIDIDKEILDLLNRKIGSDKKRNKMMSIYSYLLKYSYTFDGVILVNKNIKRLYKLYKRNQDISESYFYAIIKELISLSILAKENNEIIINNVSTVLERKKINNIQKKELEKHHEDVDNTNLDSSEEKHKYKIDKNITLGYSKDNSEELTDEQKDFIYGKIVPPVKVNFMIKSLAKEIGIKSRIVQRIVKEKLNGKVLRENGYIQYLINVLQEKKFINDKRREYIYG